MSFFIGECFSNPKFKQICFGMCMTTFCNSKLTISKSLLWSNGQIKRIGYIQCTHNIYMHDVIFYLMKIFSNKVSMAYKHQKNHIWWAKWSSKCNNFAKFWWISYSYIIFIFHLHFHTKISPITSHLKYIFHFSYFMINISLSQIYSPH